MILFCRWCDKDFTPTSKNQIYCSIPCREEAAREKMIIRIKQERIKKRVGKERRCAGNCGALLSIYNDSIYCDPCSQNNKKIDKFLKEMKYLFTYEKE
jgi:hypothetical protein